MIALDTTLISDEIATTFFFCDLEQCKGACCVEGDAGAPLDEEEISLLEDHIEDIKPFMVPAGIREIEEMGVFDYDAEGKFVTPLVNGKECVFVFFEQGIARCAVEQAYQNKKIPFPKPISCHLYPIRIKPTPFNDLLNYHKWPICRKALEKGYKEKIPLYRFLEGALIRKYGRNWFNRLRGLL
ncbi:MAG: DUF3109 family protein [Bacteroidales bacterium]|jgi:hypothetical protein|nr:DUF3109 family protein [Bacteroidales bacterium]